VTKYGAGSYTVVRRFPHH